jgi:N-sulfoglucosamine sulfohydrolase
MNNEPLARQGKKDYNFEHQAKTIFDGTDWRQRTKGQPFFAQAQIFEPHRPFVKSGRSGEGLKIPPFYPEHPVIRADWANYLASIEKMDSKVGVLLDRLKEDGLYDKTVVVFFGDHGRPHLRGKQWLYDGGLHIPLIIRHPGWEGGKVDSRLVSALDFAPTSLAFAGITPPAHMQGRNWLAPDYQAAKVLFAARDRCGDAPDRIRSVRSDRWKYIRNFEPQRSYSQYSGYKKLAYPALTVMGIMHQQGRLNGPQDGWFADTRPEEELYDLDSDPWELDNLADDPAQAEVLKTMRARLAEWMETTGDQGAEPEGDAHYMDALMAEKRADYERSMKRRKLDPDLSDREYLQWWKQELGVE